MCLRPALDGEDVALPSAHEVRLATAKAVGALEEGSCTAEFLPAACVGRMQATMRKAYEAVVEREFEVWSAAMKSAATPENRTARSAIFKDVLESAQALDSTYDTIVTVGKKFRGCASEAQSGQTPCVDQIALRRLAINSVLACEAASAVFERHDGLVDQAGNLLPEAPKLANLLARSRDKKWEGFAEVQDGGFLIIQAGSTELLTSSLGQSSLI